MTSVGKQQKVAQDECDPVQQWRPARHEGVSESPEGTVDKIEQFVVAEEYNIFKNCFNKLLALNLSLNHLVSKVVRISYEYDSAPIKIIINKGLKRMLEDPDFKDLNLTRVLWLTIDKISSDYQDNPKIEEYITIYLDELLALAVIDQKKYDNFKKNVEEQCKN
eukprot:CAMPEP_0116912452 /NCGR_PEP_ID=MMETSP0467-20121206/16094_1 /TAXON_ID=283647 /ORGANISM="Mesodinium pulex, Strain SPMC105" /LENGTH=163 /DNA_ID=CAMNT_0004588433 /DNA_START=2314 /DNA_END=2807 /DNA_ORIENTATION=-